MTTTRTAPRSTVEQNDDALDEEELLKGIPALLPPEQFRQKHRSKVLAMLSQLSDVTDENGEVIESPEATKKFLEMLGEADEFFESIAADKDGYVRWAQSLKSRSEQIFATLIAKYARAVGE
jgi:hypothetical protein